MKVRLVFGLAALSEKILCFDADLNDLDLEALKLHLLKSHAEEIVLDPARRLVLHEISDNRLAFSAPVGTEQPRYRLLWIDVEEARALARNEAWDEVRATLDGSAYVDIGRLFRPVSDA